MEQPKRDISSLIRDLSMDGLSAYSVQLDELVGQLEMAAVHTGMALCLFIAEAIATIRNLRQDHDEGGGIRSEFLSGLDELTRGYLGNISNLGATDAAEAAKSFRDAVQRRVSGYTSRPS